MRKNEFDYNQFKLEGERFLTSLVNEVTDLLIPIHNLVCDHLCFRVATESEYNYYKSALLRNGTLLTEALVNGRPICTFKLNTPFLTPSHTVWLLELPFPKSGAPYSTGFEHAECIINDCFDEFATKYPHLSFHRSGNPILNPELCLKLKDKQIKFHHHSLDRIIEIEEAKITDIIFDFDGTLIESRENIYEINRIVFGAILNREVTLTESIKNFHPEFSKLFTAFDITCPTKKNHAVQIWGKVSDRFSFKLFEGVHDLLLKLHGFGYKIHLWTARDEQSARRILKEHKIEDLFTTLSFATAVDSKPHGNSLKFDWKEASKNQFVVIGDSPSDIYGSKNTGALAAAALWDPYASKSALIKAGAELLFHQLSELEAWLIQKRTLT